MQLFVTNESINQLRNGAYQQELPDFYALKKIIENNAWHMHQPVFDHSLLSADKLLEILSSDHLLPEVRTSIAEYLETEIDDVSLADLFKLAVLLHDIGKVTTLEMQDDGTTWCPGHAEAGAIVVERYSKALGLTEKQLAYIKRIVQFHMVPFEQLGQALADGQTDKHLEVIQQTSPREYPELLLLAYADMSGCVLPEETRSNYQARVTIIKDALKNYFMAGDEGFDLAP